MVPAPTPPPWNLRGIGPPGPGEATARLSCNRCPCEGRGGGHRLLSELSALEHLTKHSWPPWPLPNPDELIGARGGGRRLQPARASPGGPMANGRGSWASPGWRRPGERVDPAQWGPGMEDVGPGLCIAGRGDKASSQHLTA